MIPAILITGKTYPLRRDLRGAGAIWNDDVKGYLVKPENTRAIDIATQNSLIIEQVETEAENLEPATGDNLRAIRQARIDRKADRLRAQAKTADMRAQAAYSRIKPHERDFLRLAEPIKVGHHSEQKHRKLIARFNSAMESSFEESKRADDLRRRAENLTRARVKGDAAAQYAAQNEAASLAIGLGDYVNTVVFGNGVIVKANKKTFSVKIESSGRVLNVEKRWCKLIEKREPIAEAIHEGVTWKAGNIVALAPDHFNRVYTARVNRKTAKGYSVDKFWSMRDSYYVTKMTVAASQITGPAEAPGWAAQAIRND